ncbi:MAG: translation initiation factor IF-2 [Chloroflexi bacterium]|nr:translation initiation factor IF-2 [Chloroflexota bacterium]MBM3175199.1 translation initiation factor IF-2 [Chloroflexota bacterium]MBM4449956.1 translation initiation factor IF-2 [Chloroflexota bacterium]
MADKSEISDKETKNSQQASDAAIKLTLPAALTVKQLADLMGISAIDVIKQLMRHGVMANINQAIDFDTAAIIAKVYGFEAGKQSVTAQAKPSVVTRGTGKLYPRPPVITIMGHVDHGKTSLLDAIRQSNIIASEAGAITQHIGAYQVEVNGRKITFLDTPGHEAFTAMRARGARSTDIAILLVAADDGVMPQTIEAMNHARAAEVPIVVAINKIDKPNANLDRVKQQLADLGLLIEEWGGDIICVPISAKKKQGIDELLENLLLLADILELKAEVDCPAQGVVIEAKLDKTKGPLATLLVQKGTLKIGDALVIGDTRGKVKAMFSGTGKQLKKAGPATPVEILGLNAPPQAGHIFEVVATEREAKALLQKHEATQYGVATAGRTLTLSDLSSQISAGSIKDLNIVLKTDVQGSIEPIKDSLEKLSDEKVRVGVIHSGTGSITESDVLLAMASKGIIVGFNSRPEPGAQRLAEVEGVSIRHYNVIYDVVNDVEKALKGMLEPVITEVVDGQAEVIAIFESAKKVKIAGVMVREGKVRRDSMVRVIRQGEVIRESRVHSLRRFKEDVKEVATGMECGVKIEHFSDFQVGDILQFYRQEKVA